jgi:hypothetical protein
MICRFPSELDGIETEKELLLRRLKVKQAFSNWHIFSINYFSFMFRKSI